MLPQQRLNQTLVDWDKCADEFHARVEEAARAEVAWERFAARKRIEFKTAAATDGVKATVDDLNAMIVNADTDGLLLRTRVADALVTGLRKRLDVFSATADAARSEIASERAREQAWAASPSVPQGGSR